MCCVCVCGGVGVVACRCVVTDASGLCVFTGAGDGTIRVWDCRNTAAAVNVEAGEELSRVDMVPETALVNTLPFYSKDSSSARASSTCAVTALVISSDHATLAAGNMNGDLVVWERPRSV